jgi:hypothetical protein
LARGRKQLDQRSKNSFDRRSKRFVLQVQAVLPHRRATARSRFRSRSLAPPLPPPFLSPFPSPSRSLALSLSSPRSHSLSLSHSSLSRSRALAPPATPSPRPPPLQPRGGGLSCSTLPDHWSVLPTIKIIDHRSNGARGAAMARSTSGQLYLTSGRWYLTSGQRRPRRAFDR